MPFELSLPAQFRNAGWKVKIREKETREPPHVTILKKTWAWRIDLRTGAFMDREPDPADVPDELIEYLKKDEVWNELCAEWDKKYPDNPVHGEADTDNE